MSAFGQLSARLCLPNELLLSNTESKYFFLIQRVILFCLIQRVIFFCLIQRVTFMHWYEIGRHAVTFLLCNFLNIFFANSLTNQSL